MGFVAKHMAFQLRKCTTAVLVGRPSSLQGHAKRMASLEASVTDNTTILCNLEHHETALVAISQWICMYPFLFFLFIE